MAGLCYLLPGVCFVQEEFVRITAQQRMIFIYILLAFVAVMILLG